MYKVGICDDETNICSFIEEVIIKYSRSSGINLEIEVWNSGESLQSYLQKGNELDILFLDIELFEISGIQVANYIRNQLEDRNMQIIFISGKSSYAQSLFKTQPMDFLVKPIKSQDIEESLKLAAKILLKNGNKFEVQIGKEYYYVPYGEIIYFYSTGRIVKVVKSKKKNAKIVNKEDNETTESDMEFYGKLKEISKKLPSNFITIHQSYIVNTDYVARYTYEMVELMDGTQLAISKSQRKQVNLLF